MLVLGTIVNEKKDPCAREAVDEAVERGVDLILMGFSYKRRFGQYSLGHVVPFVLKNSPCPVILYQQ